MVLRLRKSRDSLDRGECHHRTNEHTGMTIPINTQLTDLAPYPPGKPIEEVQRELGLDRVIKLASNENPFGPSPKAIAAMINAGQEYHLYPDGHAFALRQVVAKHVGVPTDHLIFGNGSDELLMLAAMTYLGPGKNLVMSKYAFIRPLQHAKMVGADVKVINTIPRNYEQDVEAMGMAINSNTRIVYLANPNNPTGDHVNAERVKGLIAHTPDDCLFVLDAAYHEYAVGTGHYEDPIGWLSEFPNMIVLRTFSKAYGLAGLRCGYGVASPEIIQALERVRPPFNVTRPAQMAAIAALDDADHITKAIELNRQGMKQVEAGLAAMPVKVLPSRGNFLLIDVQRIAQPIFEALMRRGVIVRPMAGYDLPQCIRVSIGTEEENDLFLAAMRESLDEVGS